jgi:hypothetical protein
MIRIPNATPTTASINTNNHHEPRRSIHQSYNPRLRPKSAPKYNINRLIGSQQEATVRYSPATTKTTVLSPRVNKQRLFDPFNVVQEPVQPQPQRRNRTSTPSPRKYNFVSPKPAAIFNEIMQQKTSTTWRNYASGSAPNANSSSNNNNTGPVPNASSSSNNHNHNKSKRSKHRPTTAPKTASPCVVGHDEFNLTDLPQYQTLKKITLQPPKHIERHHCYCKYNKHDGTWHTTIFPPKLVKYQTKAKHIEHWLHATSQEYFRLDFKARSKAEKAADVRYFHLCALYELGNQIEKKYGSGSRKNEHARVIRSVCRRLLQLDQEEVLNAKTFGQAKGEEGGGLYGGGGGSYEQRDDHGLAVQGRNRFDLADIVVKQSQIMRDLQEELRYEKEQRNKVELQLNNIIVNFAGE